MRWRLLTRHQGGLWKAMLSRYDSSQVKRPTHQRLSAQCSSMVSSFSDPPLSHDVLNHHHPYILCYHVDPQVFVAFLVATSPNGRKGAVRWIPAAKFRAVAIATSGSITAEASYPTRWRRYSYLSGYTIQRETCAHCPRCTFPAEH